MHFNFFYAGLSAVAAPEIESNTYPTIQHLNRIIGALKLQITILMLKIRR